MAILKPSPSAPTRSASRDAHAFENNLPGRLRIPAHLAFVGAERQARRSLFDEERRDAGRARRAGARHHEIEVRRSRAGDELLDPVEHIRIALAPRARRKRRGVGAGARLGQAIARKQLHRGELGQIMRLQGRRAEAVDHRGDHVVDRQIRGDAGAARRQRLEDQRRVEPRHPASRRAPRARRSSPCRAPPPRAARRPENAWLRPRPARWARCARRRRSAPCRGRRRGRR